MLQVLLNQRLGSSRCASSHFLTKWPQFLATPSYVKRFQNWNWRLRANAFANCIKTKKKNLSYCNKPKREERLSWDWIYHQKTSDLWSFHRISENTDFFRNKLMCTCPNNRSFWLDSLSLKIKKPINVFFKRVFAPNPGSSAKLASSVKKIVLVNTFLVIFS